jgi:broad specificity phosphatase PhoE
MIYIIRHAQSEYNEAQAYEQALSQHSVWTENLEVKFSGKYIDCSITEKGKEQCQIAVQALAGKQIDFVFCSPLKRAIQTA